MLSRYEYGIIIRRNRFHNPQTPNYFQNAPHRLEENESEVIWMEVWNQHDKAGAPGTVQYHGAKSRVLLMGFNGRMCYLQRTEQGTIRSNHPNSKVIRIQDRSVSTSARFRLGSRLVFSKSLDRRPPSLDGSLPSA